MATRRTSFDKLQRERAKKAKAAGKRERRQERANGEDVDPDQELSPGCRRATLGRRADGAPRGAPQPLRGQPDRLRHVRRAEARAARTARVAPAGLNVRGHAARPRRRDTGGCRARGHGAAIASSSFSENDGTSCTSLLSERRLISATWRSLSASTVALRFDRGRAPRAPRPRRRHRASATRRPVARHPGDAGEDDVHRVAVVAFGHQPRALRDAADLRELGDRAQLLARAQREQPRVGERAGDSGDRCRAPACRSRDKCLSNHRVHVRLPRPLRTLAAGAHGVSWAMSPSGSSITSR